MRKIENSLELQECLYDLRVIIINVGFTPNKGTYCWLVVFYAISTLVGFFDAKSFSYTHTHTHDL